MPRSLTRRTFSQLAAAAPAILAAAPTAAKPAVQRQVSEWSFISGKSYADPFRDLDLYVTFQGPGGVRLTVPAFWAGDLTWRVRFAPPQPGQWTWTTQASDTANRDLHGQTGALSVTPYTGANPLHRHGAIRVRADHRHFEHEDGTPFFWLGDTWWMALCNRLSWPGDFQRLAADRAAKGFNVVQIVAGLYPDMPQFDPRGANEAGFPWERDYARINPAYFDMADIRIEYLVSRGIVPCIVGCWGYYLPILGEERMRRHWRYLVARWGALPVVWCLAGEGSMPYYLSKTRDQDAAAQKQGWTNLARYVRQIDGHRHPITIHPSTAARATVTDSAVLDFDMLQTGHGDRLSIAATMNGVRSSYAAEPRMPVLVGEVCYEGIQQASREEVQRIMFWGAILSGAGGHTYGANGIWQVNTQSKPFGASPHGRSWGDTPWDTAAQLPGSAQLGLAKRLLERYRWWLFEPRADWIDPAWTPQTIFRAFAAGIPGEVRIIYMPDGNSPTVRSLEAGTSYRAFFVNPVDGKETFIGKAVPDPTGSWKPPQGPIFQDWLLILEKTA